jgi:hypothetical protein
MTELHDISTQEEVDEFLLAAYLSRGLPPEIRHEIELYLLENSKARDLLGMANEALEEAWQASSGSGTAGSKAEPLRRKNSASTDHSAGPDENNSAPTHSEPAPVHTRKDYSFVRTQLWVAALPLVVVVAGLLIWSLPPRADKSNPDQNILDQNILDQNILDQNIPDQTVPDVSGASMRATTWLPSIDLEKKAVSWPGVASASRYAVVVFSPAENTIINLETTSGTNINDLEALAYTFRSSDTNILSLWVMALDVNGAVIRSSASIPLVSNRY